MISIRANICTHHNKWPRLRQRARAVHRIGCRGGAARRAPSAGGGWTGFTVAYSVGSTQYVATWDTGLYACSTGAPVSAMCTPPM
jgi:hypothetical protein